MRATSPLTLASYLASHPGRVISPRILASYLASHPGRVISPRFHTASRAVEQHDLITFPTDGVKCLCINPEAMRNHGGAELMIKRQSWERETRTYNGSLCLGAHGYVHLESTIKPLVLQEHPSRLME
ncbi:hypothetical protein ACLB2K_073658 [Fragaria x ananassa]